MNKNELKCDCGSQDNAHQDGCIIWGNGGKCRYCGEKTAQIHGLCKICCPCCNIDEEVDVHQFFNQEVRERMANNQCTICGEPLVPAEDCKNFSTGEWDGHCYRFNCDCVDNKKIRLCTG